VSFSDLNLNPRQREAVEYLGSPLLVVAGAGSGKTRVLTAKVAWLLAEAGYTAESLLAVTFTNKAAEEMRERVRRLVGPAADGVSAGTFHSFCARLLRRHAERLGYNAGFSIYDEADQRTLIRRVLAEEGLPDRPFTPGLVLTHISRTKNEAGTPAGLDSSGDSWIDQGLARARESYQRALHDRNAMDFDDLLVNAVRVLQQQEALADLYSERFRYVLVDEYQDTNRPQYELVRLLASRHRGLCAVGDPDQSIYGWRGADIGNILRFEHDWPDARIVVLDQNYRSTQRILTTASGLIAHNPGGHRAQLWSDLGEGPPVHELVFINDEEEARGITRLVQAKYRKEGHRLGEMAVLYRTNAQSRGLERALREAGIPYTVVGGVRFYERAEIKDVLAYLRLLVNPADRVSLARALASPKRGVGAVTMERIETYLANGSDDPIRGLEAVAGRLGRASGAVEAFAHLLGRYRDRLDDADLAGLTRDLLEEAGYLESLRAEGTVESETRYENIRELLAGLEEFVQHDPSPGGLQRFLEEVSLLTDIDQWESSQEAVTLMTLHAAKGLEFDLLFLAGMEEGLLPLARATEERETLEEERRLCYVGMTRARRELYLTRARRRRRWGGVFDALPSRFMGELPLGQVTTIDPYALFRSGQGRSVARGGGRLPVSPDGDDAMPDYENLSQAEPEGFFPGQTVEHDVLGTGEVIEVTGSGERTRVVVNFRQGGARRLMLAYAKLRSVE
jgi:DNA helicase II / ATP-dependent DNA helicase PcrA